MSDNKSGAGSDDSTSNGGTTNPDGDGKSSKTEDVISRTEFVRVVGQRDELKRSLDTTSQRLAEIEATLSSKERERFDKDKDFDGLKQSYQSELEKKESAVAELKAKLSKVVVADRIKSIASSQVVENGLDDFWALAQNDFEFVENDKNESVVIVKGNPYKKVEEHIQEILAKKPYLARSQRKSGTGNSQTSSSQNSGELTIEDVNRSSDHGASIFKQKPELAKEVLKNFKIGG